jgi:hypothetical protein
MLVNIMAMIMTIIIIIIIITYRIFGRHVWWTLQREVTGDGYSENSVHLGEESNLVHNCSSNT